MGCSGRRKSLSHIDGVHEGFATTQPLLRRKIPPVLCGNRHGGCLFKASSRRWDLRKNGSFGLHLGAHRYANLDPVTWVEGIS